MAGAVTARSAQAGASAGKGALGIATLRPSPEHGGLPGAGRCIPQTGRGQWRRGGAIATSAGKGPRKQNGAGVATGPVSGSGRGLSTPVGSQSGTTGASSSRARSGTIEASSDHPFRLRQSKLHLRLSDVFPASRRPSFERLSGKPATVRRASIRQAGDFPWTSFRQAGDCPCGSFPSGEPDLPTVRFSPGEPFESLPVSRRASSRGGLSQFLRPKAPVSPDSGKVGSALGLPAASRFFPAAPPERPWPPSRRISALSALAASRKGPAVAGWSSLTAKGHHGRAFRFAKALRACG